jgi:isopenicillin N synthase-like dioxygenase
MNDHVAPEPPARRKSWERAAVEEIPVLDLGRYAAGDLGEIERLAAELAHAQQHIGFFYITNHGVPQDLVDRVFAETARFHALPTEERMKLLIDDQQTGYAPMKSSQIEDGDVAVEKAAHKPDLSEAIWIRRDRPDDDPEMLAGRLFRRNKWPENLPGFRETIGEYQRAMEALGRRMLPLYARALDLPDDYFDALFDKADIPVRLGHYPADLVGDKNQFGAAPHNDAGFLTLLPQPEEDGLEVLTQSKMWIPAPVRRGDILVNGGNCLVRFSNGRFLSTPHRVLAGRPRPRYSIPLFYNPNFDAVVQPVPSCISEDRPAMYEPTTYEQYIIDYLARVYAHRRKSH